MRIILAGMTTLLLGVLVASTVAYSGTGFTGGVGEVFTWHQDTKTATGAALTLGAFFRPDAVETLAGGKAKVAPENFVFWGAYAGRDDSPDLTMAGMGYSLYKLSSLEILLEGGGVVKSLGDGVYKLGALGFLDLPFSAGGHVYSFKVGGGFDGDYPLLVLGLGFQAGQ